MHVIGTILSAIFVALLIGVSLTFGLALMGALILVALGTAAIFYGKQIWLRWRFKQNAMQSENNNNVNVRIIEAEYTEVRRDD